MVKIISDSTCDLSPELIKKYGIDIIPLHIILDTDEYLDGVNITPVDIYKWSEEHKTTPKTSASSIEDITAVFGKALDEYESIVAFSISGDMSSTGSAMKIAAESLGAEDRVTVIDSRNLSTGIGLLVLKAAEMAMAGSTREEIAAQIEVLIPKVRASFVVDTLIYLYRGGRCNAVSALVGGMLKLHPMIEVAGGKMGVGKKYRGSMARVLEQYEEDIAKLLPRAIPDRVFITHSGCNDADVQKIYDKLTSLEIFREVLITRAGGVISSHCGPGTLGILFIEK